ncbi:hypothetical protein ACWDYH_31480 [Nocardia goodfellowii]
MSQPPGDPSIAPSEPLAAESCWRATTGGEIVAIMAEHPGRSRQPLGESALSPKDRAVMTEFLKGLEQERRGGAQELLHRLPPM